MTVSIKSKHSLVIGLAIAFIVVSTCPAGVAEPAGGHASITDTSVRLPTAQELIRVLTLRDYNTRVVVLGTMMLGLVAGIIGTFMLLRKRALMGDALSHATLPGIGVAFIVMSASGGTGKSLPGLLVGAFFFGTAGVGCVLLIRNLTRLKEDAALGIVLSVFFGLGIAIFGIVQKMDTGHAAGLESFIYGKTASMLASDAMLIAITAALVAGVCLLLLKEFTVLCFDQEYAGSQGSPTLLLDVVMMGMVVIVTVIGLQAVGLILMIALLVIPPAAARFWTHNLPTMLATSAAIGAVSGFVGAGLSALVPRLPAGAIIVVVAATAFGLSLFVGSARGVVWRLLDQRRLGRKVARQHLLRAMFERFEPSEMAGAGPRAGGTSVRFDQLLTDRSWSPSRLRRLLSACRREELVRNEGEAEFALTETGLAEARRVVRNHRLWELYLITHADIAPSHVDRDADQLEHVLAASMIEKLEGLLADAYPHLAMPPSPHALQASGGLQPARR